MTKLEAQLLERLMRRASGMEPDMARRLLAAYRVIRDSLSEAELAREIAAGRVDVLVNELLADEVLDPALRPLRVQIDRMVLDAGRLGMRDLPSSLQAGVFDVLNPAIIEAARTLDTRVIEGIKADLRETVKQHVIAGIEAGVNPRETARGLREILPLAPNQEKAIRNFRRMLENGDADALTRELRDKRFDRTVRRAIGEGLSPEQVERMTDAYRKGMIDFNAKTHARTTALDAQRAGQQATWGDAIDRGVIDADRVVRVWTTVKDSKVRPEHQKMHGEEAAWGEPYSNGQTVPGETEYGCRCFERIKIVRPQAVAA